MPAGVSWPRYLRMFAASVLSMFAGAQVVHQYYRPDLNLLLSTLKMRSKELSLSVKQAIIRLKKQNKPIREMAKTLGVAKTTVWNILKKITIPEVPPKPGELQTELLGLKQRQTDSQKQ